MLCHLPHDLLAAVLALLDQRDVLTLRRACRTLRDGVDATARYDRLDVRSVDEHLAVFLARAAACRPRELHVLGGVCWWHGLTALGMLGRTVRSVHVLGAPMNSVNLRLLMTVMPLLCHLRADHLTGGNLVIPPLPRTLRTLDLRSSHGPDIYIADLSVSTFTPPQPFTRLEQLSLVLDKLGAKFTGTLQSLAGDALRRLTLIHWGRVNVEELRAFRRLDAVVLHAPRLWFGRARLPGVRRACVPFRYAEHAATAFPDLAELSLVVAETDVEPLLEIEDFWGLSALHFEFKGPNGVLFLCDARDRLVRWLERTAVTAKSPGPASFRAMYPEGDEAMDVPIVHTQYFDLAAVGL